MILLYKKIFSWYYILIPFVIYLWLLGVSVIMNRESQIVKKIKDKYQLDCLVAKNDKILNEYFSSQFAAKITHYFLSQLSGINYNNHLVRMDHFTGYMILTNLIDQNTYIIGPYLSKSITNPALANYIAKFHIRYKDYAEYSSYLLGLKKLSFADSIALFRELYSLINGIDIGEDEINIINMNKIISRQADNSFLSLSDIEKENRTIASASDAYFYEKKVCNYIKNGDSDSLLKFLSEEQISVYSGLCDDVITDLRNMGISAITLASHSAISGGLDVLQSFRIMDLYIYLLSEEDDVDNLLSLTSSGLLRFAKRVNENQLDDNVPPVIKAAVSYIRVNLINSITITKLAAILNINQTYLSKLFKKHMGDSVSTYITKLKIEKAKERLQLTDCSLATISEELNFSSQPHFQSIFKKYTGLTPKEYRNHNSI